MELLDQIDAIGHKYPFVMMGTYFMLNSAVQALPTPTDQSRTFYKWLFGFSHVLAANWGLIGKRKGE